MRPIPRSLLIHTATLEEAERDAYGDATYTTLATLSMVRVEPVTRQVLTGTDTQTQLTLLLMVDAKNSSPQAENLRIATGQHVTWGGMRYRVETVERLFDGRRLHHMEVGLSG